MSKYPKEQLSLMAKKVLEENENKNPLVRELLVYLSLATGLSMEQCFDSIQTLAAEGST